MNYHPFSTHKSRYDLAFADTLNADVVCLQGGLSLSSGSRLINHTHTY